MVSISNAELSCRSLLLSLNLFYLSGEITALEIDMVCVASVGYMHTWYFTIGYTYVRMIVYHTVIVQGPNETMTQMRL